MIHNHCIMTDDNELHTVKLKPPHKSWQVVPDHEHVPLKVFVLP